MLVVPEGIMLSGFRRTGRRQESFGMMNVVWEIQMEGSFGEEEGTGIFE